MNDLALLYKSSPLVSKEKEWDLDKLCSNPNITWENIKTFKLDEQSSNWTAISKNPNLTWDIISDTHESIQWNWDEISANPCITWEIIQENPSIPWNIYQIARNPNITWEIIQEINLNKQYYDDKSFIQSLATNRNITLEMIKNNFDISCLCGRDGSDISKNPSITWKDVCNNTNIRWEWYDLSEHPNITLEIIKDHMCLLTIGLKYCEWSWFNVSKNPNVTWEIIKANPTFPWVWEGISENPNITWEIMTKRFSEMPKNIFDNNVHWNW